MLSHKVMRRCIASLLLMVVLAGALPMAPVEAAPMSSGPTYATVGSVESEPSEDTFTNLIRGMGAAVVASLTQSEYNNLKSSSALTAPISSTVSLTALTAVTKEFEQPTGTAPSKLDWSVAYSKVAPGTDSLYLYNNQQAVIHPYSLASFALVTDTSTGKGNAANLPLRMLYFSELIRSNSSPHDTSLYTEDPFTYSADNLDDYIYDYMYLSTISTFSDEPDLDYWHKITAYYQEMLGYVDDSGMDGVGDSDTYNQNYVEPNIEVEFVNSLPSLSISEEVHGTISNPTDGMIACITEYVNWCSLLSSLGSGPVRQYTADALQLINSIYGDVFPIIRTAYEKFHVEGYCTATNCTYADIAEVLFGSGAQFTAGASTFQSNMESPLSNFYVINGSKSFTGIDREAILQGAMENKFKQETLQQWLDTANDKSNREQDENVYQETLREMLNSSMSELNSLNLSQDVKDSAEFGIVETSDSYVAAGTESVTLSPGILQGMAFSSSYIPMQTNIYSADIIDNWRQYNNGEFLEFYFKYGFQRKALHIDQSSSAAVNYFNSGDKVNGSSRLCTLRDLIESNGNDVVLYVDTSYYNSDDALEIASNKLQTHADEMEILNEYFRNYLSLVTLTNSFAGSSTAMFYDEWNWNESAVNRVYSDANDWISNNVTDSAGNPVDGNYAAPTKSDLPLLILPEHIQTSETQSWVNSLLQFLIQGTTGSGLGISTGTQSTSAIDYAQDKYDISVFYIPDEIFWGHYESGNIGTMKDKYAEVLVDLFGGDTSVWKATAALQRELALRERAAALNPDNKFDESIIASDGGAYPANPLTSDKQLALYSGYKTPLDDRQRVLADNMDTVLYSSVMIDETLNRRQDSTYYAQNSDSTISEVTSTQLAGYSADLGVSYISAMYRTNTYIDLAGQVKANNPVFIASEKLCGLDDENLTQWHKNSLLNYALLQNLEANATINYEYVTDLDSPIYVDIFGNILTESGTVIIPAACNATLFTGDFNQQNIAAGLYYVYGKSYSVPITVEGAYSVMLPFFYPDEVSETYDISPIQLTTSSGMTVDYRKMSTIGGSTNSSLINLFYLTVTNDLADTLEIADYDEEVVTGMPAWRTRTITPFIKSTYESKLNWIAMVNVINEVMRGAPVEYIDKDQEGINTVVRNKAAIMAGIKLENLIESLQGSFVNSLLTLPDFTKMKHIDYFIALLVKLTVIATCGIAIVLVYRDAVAYKLGIVTMFRVAAAIGLSVACIVTVPAVFQVTYYGANKLLLEDEAFKILMLNSEKAAMGTELTMTSQQEYSTSDNFSIQLDTFSIPWYEELENIVFKSVADSMTAAYKKAVATSPIYSAPDVEIENDGIYITTEMLFDSTTVYFDFGTGSNPYSLHFKANNSSQTPGFYMPYYVFLDTLVQRVNAYNRGYLVTESGVSNESGITFTTKYLRGHEMSTVGISKGYFTSAYFMEEGSDILGLSLIYASDDVGSSIAESLRYATYDLPNYTDDELASMKECMWYNDLIETKLADRINVMDTLLRDFVSENRNLLDKCSDETFLEVTALYMSIKYNQLFGIPYANALEIDNLDSTDLIRLCIVNYDEAMLSSPLSYSRFVMEFGGAPSVYMAAVLTIVMWIGSFIKPLCTVLVFVSVFMSIWVFRVILRRPSANLLGYVVTMLLLCLTNFVHAVLLKLSLWLPDLGLPPLGCLLFIIVGQVCYLLVLAYVTGIALKDWYNLGANEYEKEARMLKAKFKADSNDRLNGNVVHHENNWDYYDDLVKQHRTRNKT